MEDNQSMSSTNDPFGLKRNKENLRQHHPHTSNNSKKPSRRSSTLFPMSKHTEGAEEEEISFTTYPAASSVRKPERETMETGYTAESSPAESLLASFPKSSRPPRSTPRSTPPISPGHNIAETPLAASLAQPQSSTILRNVDDAMDPIQLSYISPSDTISQLSASPATTFDDHRRRRSQAASTTVPLRDDSLSLYHHHHHANPPPPSQEATAAPPPHSLTRASGPHSRTTGAATVAASSSSSTTTSTTTATAAVQQTRRLAQLQATLDRTRHEVSDAHTARDQAVAALAQRTMEHDRIVADLQAALQQQQMSRHTTETHEQQDQRRQQYEDDCWEAVQTHVADVEATQAAETERLRAWQLQLEASQREWTEWRTVTHPQQVAALREQQEALYTQARRCKGMEQRLDEQAVALQERGEHVKALEQTVEEAVQTVERDRVALVNASKQLDEKKARFRSKQDAMQEALDELAHQRQQEEARLQEAVRIRSDFLQESEKIKTDHENRLNSLKAEIKENEDTRSFLQQTLSTMRKDLSGLQEQQNTMDHTEEERKKERAERIANTDRELTMLVGQIEVAQRQLEQTMRSVKEKESLLNTMKEQMAQEENRWQSEEQRLEDLATSTESKARHILDAALKEAESMTNDAEDLMERAKENEKKRSLVMDEKQAKLDRSEKEYEHKASQLIQDQTDCDVLANDLEQRMNDLTLDKENNSRNCEKLERKIERLATLIRSERSHHAEQQSLLNQTLEERQRDHKAAVNRLEQTIGQTKAERDDVIFENEKLQQSFNDAQGEIISLKEECTDLCRRLKSKNSESSMKLAQLDRFVKKLEDQATSLKKQEKKYADDREHLESTNAKIRTRMEEIKEKEAIVSKARKELQEQHLNLEDAINSKAVELQKSKLAEIFSKPWQQGNERVSTAFSRWIEDTLLVYLNDEDTQPRDILFDLKRRVCALEDERDEAIRLKKEADDSLERDRKIKRDLQNQLRDARAKEQELYHDIEQLSRRQSNSFGDHQQQQQQERESALVSKEQALVQLEQNVKDKEQQLVEANGRIRKMAEVLRQKESDLDEKQSRLTEERNDCEAMHARLRAMISQVETNTVNHALPSDLNRISNDVEG